MAKQPVFDEAEFIRTLERMAKEQDLGEQTWSAYDPKLAKDVRDDKLRGNKIERYEQALKNHGFVLVPAEVLGYWNDGQPHKDPMWIHPDFDLALAFTSDDIMQFFPGGPEEFWNWVKQQKMQLAAKRAGLILPA